MAPNIDPIRHHVTQSRVNARIRVIIGIYITCFGIGVFNHARDFAAYGWRPYDWGPFLLEVFWSLLIFLDALAIMLLLSRFRRAGLVLAASIMIGDVAANTYALIALSIPAFGFSVPLQATFLGFVLGSLPFVWPVKPVGFGER